MRPRRRTALNWRMRRTRRDALPSIQKEGSSLRRTVLASVGCRTCRETHVCVQGQVRRSTYVLQRLAAQRRSRLSAPTLSTLRGRPGGWLLSLFMGRRSLAGDGPGSRMRPRRRTALNWRMRRTRRDALPSIQKEGSSRRTVLASVGCRTCLQCLPRFVCWISGPFESACGY